MFDTVMKYLRLLIRAFLGYSGVDSDALKRKTAAFEAFWAEVSNGEEFGKAACRRKVRSIICSGRCSFEELLAKMREYASGCEAAGIEKPSIKLSETWLNKECYLDEEQFIPRPPQLTSYVDMCPNDAVTGLRYVFQDNKNVS